MTARQPSWKDWQALSSDYPALAQEWAPDRATVVGVGVNVVFILAVLVFLREPLAPEAYHSLFVVSLLALVYRSSPHQEAKVAALAQMQALLETFARLELDRYSEAREGRNMLAHEVNDLQLDIDELKGRWWAWTNAFRKVGILRDTSRLESLAIGTTSAVGSLVTPRVADHLVATTGFGPFMLVLLPRATRKVDVGMMLSEPDTDYVVFGAYVFGSLITRATAASALISLFPQTLESERLRDMQQKTSDLRRLVRTKEIELEQLLKKKFAPQA